MTEEQRARLEYLREDLKVWEERRGRARWSLPLDKFYNCTAMDRELGSMQRELHDLELLREEPRKKRRPRERLTDVDEIVILVQSPGCAPSHHK